MKKQIYLPIILLTIYSSCGEPNNNTSNTTNNTIIQSDTSKNKSDEGKIKDAINVIAESSTALNEKIKENRDARNMAKEPMWVYLIGSPIDNIEQAIEERNKLKEIKNIYVFKKSRREYFLIKDDSYTSERELKDSIEIMTKRISSYMNSRIKPIDLSQECKSRKYPTITEPEQQKVNGVIEKVECLICN